MARLISNSDTTIDSRDVDERIEELTEERDNFGYEDEEAAEDDTNRESVEAKAQAWADENPDDADELKTLLALQIEGSDSTSEWSYGETLIHENYFEEYAQQTAEDIGAIDPNANWPLNCIDWKEAADQLKQDYSTIDFDGETYYIRSC
jgi:hypothetical protein